MDLRHNLNENGRAQVLELLYKLASVCTSKLGSIKAMDHWIDMEQGTRPVRLTPHRQGTAMREHNKTEIKKMLASGFI